VTPTPQDLDELRLTIRPIEGAKCGQCGRKTGLVQINGHTFAVEPKALVIQGGTILLSLHLCIQQAEAQKSTTRPNHSGRPASRRKPS
jgi:hypothetical protein